MLRCILKLRKINIILFKPAISTKRLVCNGFRKVIKELHKINEAMADDILKEFEDEIENE